MIEKSKIKKILVVSLSNIGDVILTFPVIDILRQDFPEAKLSVIVGPKAQELLAGNPYIEKVFIFNKKKMGWPIIGWLWTLKKENFDLVVDLRNSAIPLLLGARYRTSVFLKRHPCLPMSQQHLNRLSSLYSFEAKSRPRVALNRTKVDQEIVQRFLQPVGAAAYAVIAPGAADHNKRWTEEGFAEMGDYLNAHNLKIILVGDKNDQPVVDRIKQKMKVPALDLSGKLSLPQLGCLLQNTKLTLVNDSAPLHLASYLDVPVVALFGPTDPQRYGPWSSRKCIVHKNQNCPKCRNRKASMEHECMRAISVSDVIKAVEELK